MTIALVPGAATSERPGRLGALPPPPPAPERARPRPGPAARPTSGATAPPEPGRVTHFLIHELLAAAPELGSTAPSRARTVAAYRAQLAQRIHYSGPVIPIDLRV
jgi:hypothetical protein